MYKQSKYVLALFLGTSQAINIQHMVMGDSDVPEEKLEHANTAGSQILRSDTPYSVNGIKNIKFDRPELDFNKIESTKGGISQDDAPGTKAEGLAQMPLQAMIAEATDGVNEDVAAVIETTTKASKPTDRSAQPYEQNGFKNPFVVKSIKSNNTGNNSAKAKAEAPASAAEVASELREFGFVQTTEGPAELGGAGSSSKKGAKDEGTAPEQVHVLDPIPHLYQSNKVDNEFNLGVWRTAFYAQQPVRFFQMANGDIAAVEPWLHDTWSEHTEPLTTWKRSNGAPARDPSADYKFNPDMVNLGPSNKPKAPVPAANATAPATDAKKAAKLDTSAASVTPVAAAALSQQSQVDLKLDTKLSKAFAAFFQKNGNKGKGDIAETHIDQWVWDKTDPAVSALPGVKTNAAPKVDKYWEGPAQAQAAPAIASGSGLPAELFGLSQARGNFDADTDHSAQFWNDPNNVDMYDSETVYTAKPGSFKPSQFKLVQKQDPGVTPQEKAKEVIEPKYVQTPVNPKKQFALVERRDNGVSPYDKAKETVYPPITPRHPAYYNGSTNATATAIQSVDGVVATTAADAAVDAAVAQSLYQRTQNGKDIAESHIDPWVYSHTNPYVDRLPYGRVEDAPKRDSYTPPQGETPSPAPWNKAYSQAYSLGVPEYQNTYDIWTRKDSAPSRESFTPPQNQTKPSPAPWNQAYGLSQYDPNKEIYKTPVKEPITQKELDALILNDQDRRGKAYDYNGVANPATPNYRQALYQVRGRGQGNDIEEKNIDERVWAFANDNVDANWARVEGAYNVNGLKNPASGYGYVEPAATATATAAAPATTTAAAAPATTTAAASSTAADAAATTPAATTTADAAATTPAATTPAATTTADATATTPAATTTADAAATTTADASALMQQMHHKKHHKHHRDIAEKQIDEQVYDFARDNVNPLAWSRTQDAFIPNGSKNPESGYGYVDPDTSALTQHHRHHHHNNRNRDISEKQMDEEVWGLANPNSETLPWTRSQDSFIPNGSKNPESGYGYVAPAELFARQHRDISEKQIDEDVQDFANANVERLPWPRTQDSFIPNGSKNPESGYGYVAPAETSLTQHHKHHHHNKKDMSEKQVDEEVWGLANPNTETLNWTRSKNAFIPNGSQNPESGYGYVAPAELYQHQAGHYGF